MNLIDKVLKEEKRILKELGYELNESCANPKYPDKYYKEYVYNLYENMIDQHKIEYGGGSGGELHESDSKPAKMAAIRSSSAMTFNLLGNTDIVLRDGNALNHSAGKYYITYEKQHETIDNGKRQQPANLDAMLVSEDGEELIFCEMKMLEWFSKNSSELKPAYKNEKNYIHSELAPQFLKTIEVLESSSANKDFEHYDVWQMFKHTLAIHNYMCEKGWDKVRKVSLLNVVFEPDESIFDEQELLAYQMQKEKEHKGFERFKYALEEAGLIKTAGKFEVKYLSAKQFMDCFQMTNKKRKYLKRYTFEEL